MEKIFLFFAVFFIAITVIFLLYWIYQLYYIKQQSTEHFIIMAPSAPPKLPSNATFWMQFLHYTILSVVVFTMLLGVIGFFIVESAKHESRKQSGQYNF